MPTKLPWFNLNYVNYYLNYEYYRLFNIINCMKIFAQFLY